MRTHEIMETWLGVRRVAKLYYPNQPIDCPGYNSIYIYLRSGSTDLNGTYFWVGKHRTGLLIFKFPEIWDGSQGIASRAALHKKCLVLLALAFQVHLRLKTKLELTLKMLECLFQCIWWGEGDCTVLCMWLNWGHKGKGVIIPACLIHPSCYKVWRGTILFLYIFSLPSCSLHSSATLRCIHLISNLTITPMKVKLWLIWRAVRERMV